jgi:hypothetical protein
MTGQRSLPSLAAVPEIAALHNKTPGVCVGGRVEV